MDSTDDPSSDQEAESAAMAAMMGFTSFGSQASARPSKKRRYNPRADAVADGDGGVGDDDEDDDEWGTGANTLPLMPRTVRARGADEARMEGHGGGRAEGGGGNDQDEDASGGQGRGKDTGEGGRDAGGEAGAGVGEEDPAPQYIDTSRSPIRTEDDEMAASLPVVGAGFGEHRSAGQGGRDGGHGGAAKRIWWTDYYDPSSNENPWEALEKARGLEAVGSWLPRGHAGQRVGTGRSG